MCSRESRFYRRVMILECTLYRHLMQSRVKRDLKTKVRTPHNEFSSPLLNIDSGYRSMVAIAIRQSIPEKMKKVSTIMKHKK